jgi:HSP20 family protein
MATLTRRGDRFTDVPPPGFLGLQRLNRLLDDAFSTWPFPQGAGALTSAWLPSCEVSEDPESVNITVELPGVRPEDVKLTVENNVLTIRGERKEERRSENEQVHRSERVYGMFERSFTLPNTVDPERIDARYENGILRITIPKAERARPREIPVRASDVGTQQVVGTQQTSSGSGSRERQER